MDLEPGREPISRLECSPRELEKPAPQRTPTFTPKGKDQASRPEWLEYSLELLPTARMTIDLERKERASRRECSL